MQAFKHSLSDEIRCQMKQLYAAFWSVVEDQVKDATLNSDEGPRWQRKPHPNGPGVSLGKRVIQFKVP